MNIPDAVVEDQIDKPQENFRNASYILLTFALLVLAKVVSAICVAIWVKCRYSTAKK